MQWQLDGAHREWIDPATTPEVIALLAFIVGIVGAYAWIKWKSGKNK